MMTKQSKTTNQTLAVCLESELVNLSATSGYSVNNLPILRENAIRSLKVKNAGKALLADMASADWRERATRYLADCRSEIKLLHERRRPVTTAMNSLLKRFTALENEIDPSKPGSPAYEVEQQLKRLLREQAEQQQAAEQRLLKNRQRTEQRVANRQDLDEAAKQALREKADTRLAEGMRQLALDSVETHPVPVVTEPEGYVDLFRFWWQEIGRTLPDEDLQRVFRPMFSYAKKQAKKGIRVKSVYVNYINEPIAA